MKKTLIALTVMLSVAILAAGWTPSDRPGLPVLGRHDAALPPGVGYCVTLRGSGVVVTVPYHAISSAARKAAGLPALEVSEFMASVRNAAQLAARKSGDTALIEATNGTFAFPDLGISAASDTTECTCATSDCYGKPRTCVPKSCAGGCADCEQCVVTGGGSEQRCRGRICTQ